MRPPLPAVRPMRTCRSYAAAVSFAAVGSGPASARTRRVWTPMSGGWVSNQARKPDAIRSRDDSSRRSTPDAATSRMATAMDVSSVHSPGAKPPRPPPIIAGPPDPTVAEPNSYPAPSASPTAEPSTAPQARSSCAVVSLTALIRRPAHRCAAKGRPRPGRAHSRRTPAAPGAALARTGSRAVPRSGSRVGPASST
jgi:hypothetical protein